MLAFIEFVLGQNLVRGHLCTMPDIVFMIFLLVEPVKCCCTVVTSQPDTVDMTVTFLSSHRRLEVKSDPRENNSHPCAQRTLHPCCVVSHSCMVAEPIFLELGY